MWVLTVCGPDHVSADPMWALTLCGCQPRVDANLVWALTAGHQSRASRAPGSIWQESCGCGVWAVSHSASYSPDLISPGPLLTML